MWSLYKKSQTLMEGSEAWQLSQAYPHAVSHDGTNVVFVATLPDAESPFVLPVFDDTDLMALAAAKYLYGEFEHGMHLTRGQAETLFRHPSHRLWCANYEPDQREQFESDYQYVGAFVQSLNPEINWPSLTEDLEPHQARQIMLQTLGG
jgi:hypothetical protein